MVEIIAGENRTTVFGRATKTGLALMALTSLLTIWTTIVRDDSTGEGYFMIVLAAGMAGFATRLNPACMARAMAGVALMQIALGLLIATAPITATVPGGPVKILIFNAVFAGLWLAAAVCFWNSARNFDV